MALAGAAKEGNEGFLKVHRSVAGDTISIKNHAMLPNLSPASRFMCYSPFRFKVEGAENRPQGTSYPHVVIGKWRGRRW